MLQKVRMCSICGFEGICICFVYATVAQLVEYDLAKVGVAGSSPVCRSFILSLKMLDLLFNASIFKDFLYMYIYYKHRIKYTDYKKVSHGISHAILSKCSLIFLF